MACGLQPHHAVLPRVVLPPKDTGLDRSDVYLRTSWATGLGLLVDLALLILYYLLFLLHLLTQSAVLLDLLLMNFFSLLKFLWRERWGDNESQISNDGL